MLALFFLIPIFVLMPKITYISHEGKKNTIEVATGLSVMEGALQNSVEGIDADAEVQWLVRLAMFMSQKIGLIK